MAEYSQEGQLFKADFFDNTGGVNLADSPFKMPDSQATNARNASYALTGGFRKRDGHTKVNSSADTAVYHLGAAQFVASNGTKSVIRFADRKIQLADLSTPTFTALTEDTAAAGSNFFAASSVIQTNTAQLISNSTPVLWCAGGGLTNLAGVYSTTKVTYNGVPVPTGSITGAEDTTGTLPDGVYKYAITYVKASTGAESNAALDLSVTVGGGSNGVTININTTLLSNEDTTKYSAIKLYRSAVGGSSGFTSGSLVGSLAAGSLNGSSTIVDDGSSTTTVDVPRAGSSAKDYSVLPSGTYSCVAQWKRRLVTCSGNVLYLSSINESEYWPTGNYFTIGSPGAITGLGILSFNTSTTSSVDEFLVVFKEKEMYILTGSTASDWALKFIDNVGSINQNVIVNANGMIAFMDYQGIYLWDGSGKPIYTSRPIENLYQLNGDIDKANLSLAHGVYFKKNREIVWHVPHLIHGTNKFAIKLDLRLTLPSVQSTLSGRIIDGVFLFDVLSFSLYNANSMVVSTTFEETIVAGDGAGYVYTLFNSLNDASSGVDFQYETKYLDLGSIGVTKRIHKIIVWVEDSTDASLTLDYWTRYKTGAEEKGSQTARISDQVSESFWDEGYWDSSYWDNTVKAFNAVVFNVQSAAQQGGGTEGDCVKLKFTQASTNSPTVIAGFTIIFSKIGLRK